jgi:hypothetical protein
MLIYAYILGAVLFRLIPHPWNVTPIAAMFLFSGATFRSKSKSLLIPLVALLVSDYVVDLLLYHGVYQWFSPFTWAGFLLVGMLGWTLRGKWNWATIGTRSVAASTIFFLVTNFGVWLGWTIYPRSGVGLVECYTAGLPFYGNTLAGDLFFTALMFGSYYWLLHRKPSAIEVSAS